MDEIGNMPSVPQAKDSSGSSRTGSSIGWGGTSRYLWTSGSLWRPTRTSGEGGYRTFRRKDLYYRLSEFSNQDTPPPGEKGRHSYLASVFWIWPISRAEKDDNRFHGRSGGGVDVPYDRPGNVRQLRIGDQAGGLVSGMRSRKRSQHQAGLGCPDLHSPRRFKGRPWKSASLGEIVQQSVLAVEKEVLNEVLTYGDRKQGQGRQGCCGSITRPCTRRQKGFGIQQNGEGHDDET